MPSFGFKAKPCGAAQTFSFKCTMPSFGFKAKPSQTRTVNPSSVPCLPLDSRQNINSRALQLKRVYHAFLWIQGKTSGLSSSASMAVYHAFLWIQGKTSGNELSLVWKCTMPSFGFKAKHRRLPILTLPQCTMPSFGFKAKPPHRTQNVLPHHSALRE